MHIVHAHRRVSTGDVGMSAAAGVSIDMQAVNRGITAESDRICAHAASEARRRGVKVETHAVPGDPADALVGVATEVGADLVVVGNRGMTGKRRFVLGSVPNKVSHHCPCSLLIVDTTSTP